MTSIFGGQPPQNKAFSNQNKGHLGSRCIYIYIYREHICYVHNQLLHLHGVLEKQH